LGDSVVLAEVGDGVCALSPVSNTFVTVVLAEVGDCVCALKVGGAECVECFDIERHGFFSPKKVVSVSFAFTLFTQ
jgi:hypothetical protein